MRHRISLFFATLAIVAGAICSPVAAQTPDELFAKGVAFLQNKQYGEAQGVFDSMVSQHGKNAMTDFGPRFGAVFYHRALAYQGQGKLAEAIADFETTATNFPNKQGEARMNPYQTVSLLMAGSSHMQMKEPDHAKALEFFKRFEQAMASNPLDKDNVSYNRAALWANNAICEAKTDKPRNAAVFFNKIANDEGGMDRATRSTFEKTTQLIQGAALDIIDAFLRSKNPEDGLKFVQDNARLLREDPGIAYFYAPRYLQIASEATKAGNYPFALALYSIIPNSREAMDGLAANARRREAAPGPNGQPSAYGALVAQIKEKLNKDIDGGTPIEVYALDGTARVFQMHNNYQAVYGIYRTLAKQYPKSKLRPEILYYAALAASVTGRLDETQEYGEAFIKEFPKHELRPRVEELMVEGMFWAGRYEDALRIAQRVRKVMPEGSKSRELCDFVVGGSMYFLGRYAEAEPELKAHVEKYKESTHREMARFYMADNLARLNRFTESGTLLDEFLRDYPESSVLDLALYSRANTHYNLDQLDSAVSRLNEFITKRPYSGLRDQAQNLFGNVFESQSKDSDAEQSYRKAKETAEKLGNNGVAAQSIVYLLGVISKDPARAAEVVALYDEFFKNYPDDPNRTKAAIIALPALEKEKRLAEGLTRLEKIIVSFGNDVEAAGLEDCIVAYVNYAEKGGMTLTQLRERLYNFPGLAPDADVARARMRMALIDLYEKKIKEEKDETAKTRLRGEIDALFSQLKRDFAIEKLPNYTLNRIGDFLMKAGKSREAGEYFEQVLKTNDPAGKDKAMFNLAAILSESDKPGDREKAIEYLEKLLADYPNDRSLGERVIRQKAIVYELGQQWEQASLMWREYLKNQAWVRYQTEAYYFLALSQEKRQLWADALASYLNIISTDPGNLIFSAPAWFRFAEIQYRELGKKQEGYTQMNVMVKQIGRLEEAENKTLEAARAGGLDPLTIRRLGERMQVNYIQRAIQTVGAWESAGGITIIKEEPKKK